VANLSYSGVAGSATVANAANYMNSMGGVVVVAAGNDGTDYGYINHPSLFVAGATTSSDAKAGYSSYGNFVDISAPGSGIYTTSRDGGYSLVSGTSFATPNTAAVAALVIAANPALLPSDVTAVIANTAVDLGATGWDPSFGYGRVNAQAAAEMAANVETSDNVAPDVSIVTPVANAGVNDLVSVIVQATDGFSVARVDFLVGGAVQSSSTQTVGGNQYSFSWDSTQVNDGSYRLGARAVDEAGNVGSASDVWVTVSNVVDESVPTVTILSPANGASGTRSVSLSAMAQDDNGVTQLSIYADGKLRCSGTSSASCSWNVRKVADGTYPITAKARDAAGNEGTATVNFTVGGGSSDGGGSKGGGKGRKAR